jgi:hypothetical protein
LGAEMVTKEEELIERLMRENEEFLKVKQAHVQLANQLEELEKKSFITPQDEVEIKIIKKKKLALKDQMEKILVQYR